MSLAFERVSFAYEKDAPVLVDVDFELAAGEALGVCGPIASGKSTLLRLAALLEEPEGGRILIDGAPASGSAGKRTRSRLQESGHIGMLFQYPERQLFCPSVREDVAFGPRNLGLSSDEVDARVREALAQSGLDANAFGEKSPFELSGGEARRVALAGVLALKPRLLVLDEPTAGLDPVARASFLALIESVRTADDIAVLIASHNMDDLARLCNRVLVLDGTGKAQVKSANDAFSNPEALQKIGLEAPFAPRFAARLTTRGFRFDKTPLTVEELARALARLSENRP